MVKALELRGLTKNYRGFQLGPLDLDLVPGRVMGLVGPNGAGKTTTILAMMGLVKASGGKVTVFGRDADPGKGDWKAMVGYVGDEPVFYENWTGARNLKFISGFYPDWSDERALALARRFQLPLDKKARELSRGNRVKLALVSVLARSPQLFLFDEPTQGLDPVAHYEVLEALWEAMRDGTRAILYSTHNMADIGKIADEVVFLNEGRIALRTVKDDLENRWRRISFRLTGAQPPFEAVASVARDGQEFQVVSYDHETTVRQLRSIGAASVTETPLSFDEIAVQILKGGGDVASG